MTLLVLKRVLKKIWVFLKHYWYVPVIAVLLIVMWVLLRKKPEPLAEVLTNSFKAHKKEVEALDRIHEEEIEKREKAIEEYHKTVETVEKKFEERNVALNEKEKKQIEKIVKESKNDPDELAKRLSEKMGFELVKNDEHK